MVPILPIFLHICNVAYFSAFSLPPTSLIWLPTTHNARSEGRGEVAREMMVMFVKVMMIVMYVYVSTHGCNKPPWIAQLQLRPQTFKLSNLLAGNPMVHKIPVTPITVHPSRYVQPMPMWCCQKKWPCFISCILCFFAFIFFYPSPRGACLVLLSQNLHRIRIYYWMWYVQTILRKRNENPPWERKEKEVGSIGVPGPRLSHLSLVNWTVQRGQISPCAFIKPLMQPW